MSHNIDITDGIASFASAREDAWHHLGTVTKGAMTAAEAMELAHLSGWNVRKQMLLFEGNEDGSFFEVPNRFAVVRDNPISAKAECLGVVGDQYNIVQNEEHIAFLDTLVDESGAHFETAGALDGGRKVFITMKLPESLKIGGCDPVDQYLAAINSHDGTTAFTVMVTPVRIVCQNTLNVSLGNYQNKFTVRHTSSIKGAIQTAREALELTFGALDEFSTMAERMVNTTLTDDEFRKILEAEFSPANDATQAAFTRAENRMDMIFDLFQRAGTQEGIRNTVWAGFNAMTEYADHFAPGRGTDDNYRFAKAVLKPDFKETAAKMMVGAL